MWGSGKEEGRRKKRTLTAFYLIILLTFINPRLKAQVGSKPTIPGIWRCGATSDFSALGLPANERAGLDWRVVIVRSAPVGLPGRFA